MAGAALVMVLARRDTHDVLKLVDWHLPPFFAALFVVVDGLSDTGLPEAIYSRLQPIFDQARRRKPEPHLVFRSGIERFLKRAVRVGGGKLIARFTDPVLMWKVLALGTTFAGNLTIIGSVANMIVVESARDHIQVGFWDYARFGIPITILTTVAGVTVLLDVALSEGLCCAPMRRWHRDVVDGSSNQCCVGETLFGVARRVHHKRNPMMGERKRRPVERLWSEAPVSNRGKIHMPRQRADDCSSRTLPLLTTNACLSIESLCARFGFLDGQRSGIFARQNFFTGQTLHFGLSARQTRAPRSMSAELKRAALRFGTSCAANASEFFAADCGIDRGAHVEQSGQNTRAIRFDDWDRLIESKGCDCVRDIATNARQFANRSRHRRARFRGAGPAQCWRRHEGFAPGCNSRAPATHGGHRFAKRTKLRRNQEIGGAIYYNKELPWRPEFAGA